MSEHIDRLRSALEGRYRIKQEIGEGGMATVYLARDLKHNRKVALKVLRPDLAAVVGAERFLAEIETTANLQHPHILPLFDSGEADGFLFYVMPYVEGESLRERLEREKQLPVDEAVRIAIDVAEALQAAHDEGIIHRDIKPANILLSGGRPLIADFGIALAVSAAGGGRLTETGLSLGTPFYMSPEQASADRQPTAASDVYSLGCVLYEMLVGEPPYTGGSAQAVLAKILTADAAAPTATRPTVPPNVDAAIRRAIEKLPADRFTRARDFAAALRDDGFRHPRGAVLGAAESPDGPSMSRNRVLIGSATTAIVALGVGLVVGWLTAPEPPRSVARFELDVPDEVVGVSACCGPQQALSPDGSWLVFRGETEPLRDGGQRLYRRRRGSLEPEVIPGTEGAGMPFFSPDGTWLAFHADGRLMRIPMGGGPPVPIAQVSRAEGASWGDDDVIVFSQADGPLFTVPASGGDPTEVPNPQELNLIHPWMLPGGGFALARSLEGTPEEGRIFVVDLESGEAEELAFGTYAAYASGHVLFSGADGTLLAQPFDPDARRTTGPAVAILDGVARAGPSLGEFTLSTEGALVYQFGAEAEADEVLMIRGSRVAGEVPLSNVGVDMEEPAFSPDGQRLAVSILIEGRERIWIWDRAQETQQLLTVSDDASEEHRVPVWHPDGSRIAYGWGRAELTELIYVQPVDGSGPAEPLMETDFAAIPHAWTPDGQRLIFVGWPEEGQPSDIGIVSEDGLQVEWLVETEGRDAQPVVSPDGRWLAFSSTRSGQSEVYVQPLDGGGGWTQISAGGGHSPRWTPDGRGLYYASWEQGSLILASLTIEDGVRVAGRSSAYPLPEDLNDVTANWDLSPDGEEIVYISRGELEGGITFVWVLNWPELVVGSGVGR